MLCPLTHACNYMKVDVKAAVPNQQFGQFFRLKMKKNQLLSKVIKKKSSVQVSPYLTPISNGKLI